MILAVKILALWTLAAVAVALVVGPKMRDDP